LTWWVITQERDWYRQGTLQLVSRCNKCFRYDGDYLRGGGGGRKEELQKVNVPGGIVKKKKKKT